MSSEQGLGQQPASRPLSTISASGGDRTSKAPTVFLDALSGAANPSADNLPLPRPLSTISATGGDRTSKAPTVFVDAPSEITSAAAAPDAAGDFNLPLPRPISNFSAVGGDRFSQAPTLFAGASEAAPVAAKASASEDDLLPPTALANRNSAALGDGTPSNVSVADSSRPFANNLPYRTSLAPTAVGSTQQLGDSDKEAAASDAARGTSPFPDLGQQPDSGDASKKKRKKLFFILGGVALVIVAAAVAVPVALTQTKKSSSASSSSSDGNHGSGENGGPTNSGPKGDITGGDGTTITTDKGTTFTYVNKFGGTWYDDPDDPFNNNAQAQSWSPPLSQEWDYQKDTIRGVNLGGWLVPEPFIVPALYEPYLNNNPHAQDEWTLTQNMAADTANGGLDQLEKHYDTFITEEDFAQIAGAGLNWVRIPIGFWAVEKLPDEPFLEKVSWKYALKAFKWARKYGLRVHLDLHSVPGSQNAFDHSGKGGENGQINFLYGPMGLANAQRTLDAIRVLTEFISQPEYVSVVPMFGIINEAMGRTIGDAALDSFFLEAHDMIRGITGTGAGKGPWIALHDAFRGLAAYKDYLPGHDRIAVDTHPYLMFGNPDRTPLATQVDKPCTNWGASLNTSRSDFGVTVAGEFSLAFNDCGRWINGVGAGTRWEGTYNPDGTTGDCTEWNDYANWSQDRKDSFRTLAMNSFDALGHWYFWTWKIGASIITGKIETPMWSYSLGLQNGWIPEDPREAVGSCGGRSPADPFTPEMLGLAGPGQVSAAVKARFPWPPTTIQPNLRGNNVPVYTATGAIPTLPVPTPTKGTADGWFDDADTRPMYTPIAGCTYPDAWGSAEAANPGPCDGTSAADDTTTTDTTDDTAATDEETRRIRRVRNVIPRPKRTPAA